MTTGCVFRASDMIRDQAGERASQDAERYSMNGHAKAMAGEHRARLLLRAKQGGFTLRQPVAAALRSTIGWSLAEELSIKKALVASERCRHLGVTIRRKLERQMKRRRRYLA
jgi:hypothetical protein